MSLEGQTVVVMGGSSGVGLAVAQSLASAGTSVVITGRDQDKLIAAIGEIGANASAETVDATDVAQVEAFFAHLGPFDHLVLALSGGKGGGPFRDLNMSDLREGFDAKFWPHAIAAQTALKTLRTDGSLTFISAISAHMANPGTAGLAAINAAIEALVPVLAVELKPLRVNAVSPGVIDTPWWNFLPEEQRQVTFAQYAANTPVGRIGKPEDVAHTIRFLIENTFMTGAVIECDGGVRLM